MSVFKNFLVGLDQSLNTLIRIDGEYGHPDEMLSARAWRVRHTHPQYAKWIDRLFFWDYGHCQRCYNVERQLKQLPGDYRA